MEPNKRDVLARMIAELTALRVTADRERFDLLAYLLSVTLEEARAQRQRAERKRSE